MSYPVTFLQIKITNKKGREGGWGVVKEDTCYP